MAPDVLRAAIPACLMFVGAAQANERSAELVNSFQIFCTLAPLDFAALDAKATAMKLVVRKDIGTPRQPGQFAQDCVAYNLMCAGSKSQYRPHLRGALALSHFISRFM